MSPAVMRALAIKGYTGEQIAEIAEIVDADAIEHRLKIKQQTRLRVQAWRARNAMKRMKRVTCVTAEEASRIKDQVTRYKDSPLSIVSKKEDRERRVKRVTHGSRLPADWRLSEGDRGWSLQHSMTTTEIEHEAEQFRDYWIAQPGQRGVKLDWPATWRRWCRTFLERGNRQASLPLVKTMDEINSEYQANLVEWNKRHAQAH